MKKKTSSILLLSAFAALVLAGCNSNSTSSSSKAAESLESSVTQSTADEPKSEESKAESQSAPAATSTPASESSKATETSSVQPEPASSAPKTWTEMGIVGEYKGGMTSLVINADETTSWDTDNTKFAATCTDVGNGVYHIVSDSTVAAENKIDVYTDGTMAYVVHDGDAQDNYVMDKTASGASATAFAETEDEDYWFGGVEITTGHWKYFANINGVFHFGVTLTVEAGTNINNGGAIFKVTVGANAYTFRVTSAAANVGAFATVEAFNLTTTTYAGDHGDLVIGKTDAGELAFVKLDGNEIEGATLDGDVVTVKDADTETYTQTSEGVFQTCTTTTYTLAPIARTYTTGTGEVSVPLFHELTGTSGSYSVEVGEDGHLWARFKSSVGGVMHITETTQVPYLYSSYSSYYDTYLIVYKADENTNYAASSSYSSDYIIATDEGYSGYMVDAEFDIEPNVTYVMKLGGYGDNSKSYKSTGSTMAGETEAMDWVFTPNVVETYTGTLGDLAVEKSNGIIKNLTLAGEALSGFTINGNAITCVAKTADTSDPTNITFTTTTTVITLDPDTMTYTSTITSDTANPFTTLGASDTSFSHATDSSGNTWASFTPATDGVITITETEMGAISDTYLAVYDLTALGNDITKLTDDYNHNYVLTYTDSNPAVITNLSVTGGHTYIIKHGAYSSRALLIGDTATSTTYVNTTIAYSFSYVDLTPTTYTGTEGDLVTWYKSGEFHHATLAGAELTGAEIEGDAIVIKGTPTYDTTTDPDNPTATSTDTIYTLDTATSTYVKTTPTVTRDIVTTLTETSTGLSGTIGDDGSIWASFTPTADGYITIDETVQATNGSSHDTLVAVYEKKATGAAWSDYVSYYSNALNGKSPYSTGADNGTSPVYVHDLPVEAGKTYIIKIGAYAGNSYYIGSPMSSYNSGYVGSQEAFSFRFDKTEVATFTGDEGDLQLTTFGAKLTTAILDGTTLSNDKVVYDHANGTLSVAGTSTYDLTTDPLDPLETRTDKVYTLDRDAGTYTVSNVDVSDHIFGEITAGTPFNGTTGKDGSYYAKFTATADGVIKVKDTVLANSSDYIIVYEAKSGNTAANYKGTYKSADNNNSFLGYKYCYSANSSTDNIEVEAGKTYIIKVCSSSTYSYAVGQTASSTYQNLTGTIELSFTPYVYITATGASGDLKITTLNGNMTKVTLDGTELSGAVLGENEDGNTTVTVAGTAVVDYSGDEPVISKPSTVYTLSEDGSTYTVTTTTETSSIYQVTATATGGYSLTTGTNGLALMKFVVPADGSYTVSATMPSSDVKLGLYTDAECTTLVSGTSATDSKGSAQAETVTFTGTAGQVVYIKTAQYYSFSTAVSSTSTSSYAGYAVNIVIS